MAWYGSLWVASENCPVRAAPLATKNSCWISLPKSHSPLLETCHARATTAMNMVGAAGTTFLPQSADTRTTTNTPTLTAHTPTARAAPCPAFSRPAPSSARIGRTPSPMIQRLCRRFTSPNSHRTGSFSRRAGRTTEATSTIIHTTSIGPLVSGWSTPSGFNTTAHRSPTASRRAIPTTSVRNTRWAGPLSVSPVIAVAAAPGTRTTPRMARPFAPGPSGRTMATAVRTAAATVQIGTDQPRCRRRRSPSG